LIGVIYYFFFIRTREARMRFEEGNELQFRLSAPLMDAPITDDEDEDDSENEESHGGQRELKHTQ